ncbi:putative RNA helicase [Kalmusia sp. IMI 367209]|nr:putative RNA helicase [Kalmusia sp. IMI 367209]
MTSNEHFDGLSETIAQAIREYFARSDFDINLPQDLNHPILRVDTFLEDQDQEQGQNQGTALSRSLRVTSNKIDLVEVIKNSCLQNSIEEDARDESTTSRSVESEPEDTRRRGTGRLRVANKHLIEEDVTEHQRQMASDTRIFPKRRKVTSDKFVFRPSTLDKLILGIWEQLHGTLDLNPQAMFEQIHLALPASSDVSHATGENVGTEEHDSTTALAHDAFSNMNVLCRKITQASRVCRSIEIIVQARWIELFDDQVQSRVAALPQISRAKHHKGALIEACRDFGWSEKELRNKIAVWRGYKEVKDAAGWAALVFSGMGIYRFCKYRVEFTREAMKRLQILRPRFEVVADTLHPSWRQLLSIVGVSSRLQYVGHPHDWVVSEDGSPPVPLRSLCIEQDPYFEFEQLEESIIDQRAWRGDDPRWVPQPKVAVQSNGYTCAVCGEKQSEEAESNSCYCFPNLFGCVKRRSPPVQVYRTQNGRNNGLLALTPFERGCAIGEFVGLITKGVRHVDVMDGSTATASYQIWQGRQGNFTRFINHSCKANAQVTQFTCLVEPSPIAAVAGNKTEPDNVGIDQKPIVSLMQHATPRSLKALQFEGTGITSSKLLNPVMPTGAPQIAGPKCCNDDVTEQFLYEDVCFCRLFPAEQGPPVAGAPVQVVPTSPKNFAVYNPVYFGLDAINPAPAFLSVKHRRGQKYRAFGLRKICYACESPLPEGGANTPLAGDVEIIGYDELGNKKGALNLPFSLSLNDQMQCVTFSQEQGLDKIASMTLQCAVGVASLRTHVGVATVIDDVVLVLYD